MTTCAIQRQRLAMISELVRRAGREVGQATLMNWLYLLKAVKHAPLPYSFSLYAYGPFDGSVIEDVQYAEYLGIIESKMVQYPGGYGYSFRTGPQADWIATQVDDFLNSQNDSIAWVLREFGERTAVELEIATTLIYVDRRGRVAGTASTADLVEVVRKVKPPRHKAMIAREAERLAVLLAPTTATAEREPGRRARV